jgi:hypothetical protein
VDDTTPPANSGNITNPQDTDWASRYTGLQRVLSTRDRELAGATSELGKLQEEHAKVIAELDTYRQRDVNASEEATAREQYEALRARFGVEETPTPVGNSQARTAPREDDWLSAGSGYNARERTGDGTGFPIA